MKLEGDMDPDGWITKLEGLKTDMNQVNIRSKSDTTDVDLIIQILALIPGDYNNLEDKLMTTLGDILNLQEVRDKITIRHDQIKQHDKEQKDGTAFVLSSRAHLRNKWHDRVNITKDDVDDDQNSVVKDEAHVFSRQQKARCHKCGLYGCRGDDDCPEAKNCGNSDSPQNVSNYNSRNFGARRNPGTNTGNPSRSSGNFNWFPGQCHSCGKWATKGWIDPIGRRSFPTR